MDSNANEKSKLVNIYHISCKKIFIKLRIYIFKNLLNNEIILGEFELEDKAKLLSTYFGIKRMRGKKGHGAARKTPVFELLKEMGVYM